MLARVNLACLPDSHLLLGLGIFFLDPFFVVASQLGKLLHDIDGVLLVLDVVLLNERFAPLDLVEAMKHSLFHFTLLSVNHDRIVVLVEAADDLCRRRLVQIADV